VKPDIATCIIRELERDSFDPILLPLTDNVREKAESGEDFTALCLYRLKDSELEIFCERGRYCGLVCAHCKVSLSNAYAASSYRIARGDTKWRFISCYEPWAKLPEQKSKADRDACRELARQVIREMKAIIELPEAQLWK
jgi:hypothetical protein